MNNEVSYKGFIEHGGFTKQLHRIDVWQTRDIYS